MAKKVLVVDNDPEFVDAIVSVLESNGYATDSATDGEEGFEKAKSSKPDLVLLDVMMKHVSEGLDVAMKLRDDPATAKIPVVLLTGIRKPDFLATSYRPGEEWPNLKATLEKPVKPTELLAAIGSAMR
jgi:CheY-like chemotaxis protein